MRTRFLAGLVLLPFFSQAQLGLGIGVKAGVNFSNVTKASEVRADSHTGYMFGGYISPKSKKTLGFRSELILSRQGYDFKTGTDTGDVDLDYLLLPQLITLNFSRYIQLHIGPQIAFLLNAKVDSSSGGGNGSGSLLDYFNRFDYGLAAGGELFPFKGLFIGARYNISFNNFSHGGTRPNFIPDVDAKHNVVQVYAGWRF